MSTDEFAKLIGRQRYTVARWCRDGLIPGAVLKDTGRGEVWQIPASAVKRFQKPERGRPKGAKNRLGQLLEGCVVECEADPNDDRRFDVFVYGFKSSNDALEFKELLNKAKETK